VTPLNLKLRRDLVQMRGQVIALTLVATCGIAAYVTMRTSYDSLVAAQAEDYSRYRFADVFVHCKRAPEPLASSLAAVPGVAAVETRLVMEVTLDIPGLDEPATAKLVSIPSDRRPKLNDVFVVEGRYPQAARGREVLISQAFADANHLGVGGGISAIINGKWERLLVVGKALSPEFIYEVRPGEVFSDNRRFGVLWMPRSVMGPPFQMDGAFNDAVFSLERGAQENDVIARVDQLLDRYGGLGAFGRSDHTSARIVADHIGEIRVSGMILPAIFLGIVAFLLHILMSRLVSTQRGQIAVLKAFGYRNWEIGWHYLKLALAAVTAGTAAGILLGLWLGSGMLAIFAQFFRFSSLDLRPDPRVMLTAAGISGVAACLGALSAAHRAAALAPAEAMHPAPPPRFRPSWVERSPLRNLLSPASRMIVRNLDRRRMRALLSALALIFAVVMLVIAWYRLDAIEQLAVIQFDHVQREDMTVIFTEPRPDSIGFDLAHLPGVLRVELFRQVPVRLRFGHRMRRTAISGLQQGNELRQPLDSNLAPVELPEEGLLLNSRLAEILGAAPGDVITVEVLEGARPVRRIPAVSLVDEPVGLNAYMDARSLHRLLREGSLASGAYLKVDPRSSAALYRQLKRTPVVAGVAVREAMVASYWQTIGDSIRSTTVTMVGFAAVIAIGIVYNGARIALSERGAELASLRVLGFFKSEIGRILLGEQMLLTLLSIPVGLWLGHGLAWWIAATHSRDILRLPFVVSARTYAFSCTTLLAAALLSAAAVARKLQRMDLTAVLKSRE
jgi:putative ABC transport system permease protein